MHVPLIKIIRPDGVVKTIGSLWELYEVHAETLDPQNHTHPNCPTSNTGSDPFLHYIAASTIEDVRGDVPINLDQMYWRDVDEESDFDAFYGAVQSDYDEADGLMADKYRFGNSHVELTRNGKYVNVDLTKAVVIYCPF